MKENPENQDSAFMVAFGALASNLFDLDVLARVQASIKYHGVDKPVVEEVVFRGEDGFLDPSLGRVDWDKVRGFCR